MPVTSVDQAAAVCYRWKDGQLEFLLILTGGRRRIFPKGRIEDGELARQTAQREAQEEAGAAGTIRSEPLTVFRHLKHGHKGRGKEKRVAAYLLEVESTVAPREPHRDPQWYTPDAAMAALAKDRDLEYAEELRRVVRAACRALGDAPAPGKSKPPTGA